MNARHITAILALTLTAVAASPVKADNWYAEVGVGYIFPKTPWGTAMNDNLKYDWKGSNPAAVFEVGRRFDNGINVYYQHVSNWRTGFPVNDKSETGIDMAVVSYRFKW